MTNGLSHMDDQGGARMVDVSRKKETRRQAIAEGCLTVPATAWEYVTRGTVAKGELWNTARVAAILAAKRTADVIPLCHPVRLRHVSVEFALDPNQNRIIARVTVTAVDVTGVEMEAMHATTIALLVLYDMLKSVAKECELGPVRLVAKSGGKSGEFRSVGGSLFTQGTLEP